MLTHSHNDQPDDDDAFQQNDFIAQIAEVIKTCQPPKGIAINGYWGSGKTSALIQLHKELTGIKPGEAPDKNKLEIMPVWFEAWRYQNEATPIVALLQEIRTKFSLWNSFLDKNKKLIGITLKGVLGVFDETLKAASGGVMNPALGKIPEIAAQWEKDQYQNLLASQHLSQLLEEAIETALGNKNRKLVIFIDDMDRCMPETALKLLEGIKVYLNLKNCVVVFGMDQRQIETSLRKALNLKDDAKDGDHHAREYLEKICQDIYHLPIPDQKQKSDYLINLIKKLKLGEGNNHEDSIEELNKVLTAYDCLPANPRKIKALANRLAIMFRKLLKNPNQINSPDTQSPEFDWNLWVSGETQVANNTKPKYCLIMAVAIIYTFHRRLNEQLAKNPSYIRSLIIYANNPASDPIYEPMNDIKPSFDGSVDLPVNPSDSNVFRLHKLLKDLETVTNADIKPLLNL